MPPKRGRVDSGEEADEATSAATVTPRNEAPTATVVTNASAYNPIRPKLTEIPNILLIEMMQPQPEKAARALEKLHELMNTDHPNWKRNRVEACQLGAHCMIGATMMKWQDDRGVQEWGCFSIQSLSYIDSNEAELIACGVVEAVINALKIFPKVLGVQWAGCGALRNLLSGFDTANECKRKITKRFVQEYGGLDVVVKAIEQFPADEDLLIECFVLFQNLAPNQDYREAMIDADVVRAASVTLKNHSKDSPSNKEATECMSDMFRKH